MGPFLRSEALQKVPIIAWLGLIVLLSTILKLMDITRVSLWIDEAYSFLVANGHPYPQHLTPHPVSVEAMYDRYLAWQPLSWNQLIAILKQNVHMPLYYLLLNPWLGWVGNDEFGLRSFSTLFSSLAIFPVYKLGKSLSGRSSGGLWSAFFFAFVPFQLFFAQEGRMYALAMFWAVTSAWCLWELVTRIQNSSPGKLSWLLTYTLSTLAGVFSHYMFLFYLAFQVTYVVSCLIKRPTKAYVLFTVPVIVLLVALAWWYPVYQLQKTGVQDNYHFAKGYMGVLRYVNKFFLMPMESYAGNNLLARLFYFPLATLLLAGYLFGRLWRRQLSRQDAQPAASPSSIISNKPELTSPGRHSLACSNTGLNLTQEGFLLLWMFVPIAIQVLYDIVNISHTSIITRYLMLVSPAMCLWAGLAISRWSLDYPVWTHRLSGPLVAVMLVYAVASVWHDSPVNVHSNKKNIDQAAAYLSEHLQPGDLVFTNGPLGAPNLMVFYLMHTHPKQPIVYWVKDYNNQPTPLPNAESIKGYNRVWFFANRSDERRGLKMAGEYIQQFYPQLTPSIDPDQQLDLYSR